VVSFSGPSDENGSLNFGFRSSGFGASTLHVGIVSPDSSDDHDSGDYTLTYITFQVRRESE
jgi:hypothetical protein